MVNGAYALAGHRGSERTAARSSEAVTMEVALRRAAIINAALLKMCALGLPGLDDMPFIAAIDSGSNLLARANSAASLKLAVRQIAQDTERHLREQKHQLSAREDLYADTVRSLISAMSAFGTAGEAYTAQLLEQSARLERLAAVDDPQAQRQSLLDEATALRQAALAKQQMDGERMTAFRELAAPIQAGLATSAKESMRDQLTGLPNRAAWEDRMQEVERQFQIGQRATAIAVVGLDPTRSANDKQPRRLGDEDLLSFASIARNVIGKHGYLVRYGGDEFCVLMRAPSIGHASGYFDRLLQEVREHSRTLLAAGQLPFIVSIGLAYSNERDTAASLLERAGRAVYAAKEQGRDRIVIAPM